MAISHAAAYAEANAAVATQRSGLTAEQMALLTRYLMAVAWLETNYGYGWKAQGKGSNNMGAITGSYNGQYFLHGDSSAEGKYIAKFRKYPSRFDGWVDLFKVMYGKPGVEAAAERNDPNGVSQALYDAHYYLGTSKDPAVNVGRHVAALNNALHLADAELGPRPGQSAAQSMSAWLAQHGQGTSPASEAGVGTILLGIGVGGLLYYALKSG